MTTFTNYANPQYKLAGEVTDDLAEYQIRTSRVMQHPTASIGSLDPLVGVAATEYEGSVWRGIGQWIDNFATHSVGTKALEKTVQGGFEHFRGYLDSELLHDVTISPVTFELEFIVELAVLEVTIWNSDPYNYAVLSAINVIDGSGTTIESITLPKYINRFWSFSFNISVNASGSPSQDTTYRFTINGQDYDVTITGIRVLPFTFDIDWGADIGVTYNYESSIYKTEIFHEQRRPLLSAPFREMDFIVVNDGLNSGRIFHLTMYGKDKIFGVPIYTEQMIPTSMASGTYEAFIEGVTTHLWNLNNLTDYAIIIDPVSYQAEIKKIDEIKASSIVFENSISYSFNLDNTVIYPCLLSIISDVAIDNYTDSLSGFRITFAEY